MYGTCIYIYICIYKRGNDEDANDEDEEEILN
jgi:hypothetical protein